MPDRHATWLELFYDLVFVVVIFQLAHYLEENFTLNGFLGFLALFVPVWWSWTGAVFYATRFDTDDLGHRILVLLQMVGAAFLAVYVSDAFGDGSVGFALSYAAIRIILVLEYVRTGTSKSFSSATPLIRRYSIGYLCAAIVWIISAFIPPPQVNGGPPLWWVLFHQTPDVPEALVQGKEMTYLSWFYQNLAYNPAAITQTAINEYVSHYSAPGGMRAGFEYYRAIPQGAIQNENYSKTNLTMPVLALGAGNIPTFGGHANTAAEYGMKILAQNVTGITVPNSGHFIQEEQPDVVVKLLNNFFRGNSTTSSK
ncbi:MAG: low temperature requirement protein A [Nitrososphaeraceae archaeon]